MAEDGHQLLVLAILVWAWLAVAVALAIRALAPPATRRRDPPSPSTIVR